MRFGEAAGQRVACGIASAGKVIVGGEFYGFAGMKA
jgi:hypothetical protein